MITMPTGEFKSPLGLIRAEVVLKEEEIEKINFTGDFFIYPEERLREMEDALVGLKAKRARLKEEIENFYDRKDVKTPNLKPEHWVRAIERALEEEDGRV